MIKPVYQASTTLIVGKKAPESGQDATQMLDNNVLLANQQLAKTYATIAQSRNVEQNVIKALGLSMSVEEINGLISITPVKTTEILEIQVTNTDPALAASNSQHHVSRVFQSRYRNKKSGQCQHSR